MNLKPHQQKAVDILLPFIEKNERINAVITPGAGGTWTIINLLFEYCRRNSFQKNILILVKRKAVLEQTKQIISEVFQLDGNRIEIETTLFLLREGKYRKYKNKSIDLICILECEEYSFEPSLEITKAIEFISPKSILGIHTHVKNIEFFGELAYKYDYGDAVADGLLRSAKLHEIDIDYNKNNHVDAFLDKKLIPYIIKIIDRNKKTIIFCKDKVSAKIINEKLQAQLPNKEKNAAELIISDRIDQSHIINYRAEAYPFVLVNVKLLEKGVDLSNTENIVFLKDYTSRDEIVNIVSRYSRPYYNLEYLNIYDFAQNADYFSEGVLHEFKSQVSPSFTSSKSKFKIRGKRSVDPVLGAKELASEMSEIIKDLPEDQGRMIGIFGEWGRGKTFFMEEIWKQLKEENSIERIDFHAWKYQETPALWAYLYENFSKKYFNSKWLVTSIYRRIKLNLKRQGYFKIILFAIPLLFSIIYYLVIPFETKFNWFFWLLSTFGIGFLIGSFIIYSNHKNTARELFNIYFEKISFSKILGIQSEVQKELKYLIEAWDNKSKSLKLVLFVDDIDRCSEEKIIKIIDSLRVMLEDEYLSSKIIVVAAIDERILKRAIQHKYHNLLNRHLDGNDAQELVSEYFDKLFLLGIKLGDLNASEISEFIKELTKNDIEISNSAETNYESKIVTDDSDDDFNEVEEFPEESIVEIEEENDNNNGDEEHSNSTGNSKEKKLTNEEAQILFEKIKRFESATPRQIRIFYYRFQLAKNLLHMEYTKLGEDNVWAGEGNIDLFVELLVDFSKPYHPNVSDEFVKMKSYKKELISLGKDKKSVKAIDYKVLLKVFNLVIAY